MEQRNFGRYDLKSSVIGFGGWPMGKGQYGPFEEKEAIAAVHTAIDLGITLFDTAAVYGWGYGEELLGRALKGRRDQVVLVTKGGLRWNPTLNRFDRDSTREHLRDCLEGSLKRLQTDYVDLYLIHWPDTTTPFQEAMEALADLQRDGLIRYGGVSNFTVDMLRECVRHFPVVTDQMPYNMFDRRIERDVIPFCREHGIGIMAYGSLAHGLLTGTMTPETRFGEDDWRRSGYAFGLPLFKDEYFLRNLRVVERLRRFAQRRGRTVAQLALAWVISNPAITVALAGARNPREVEENVRAAEWRLDDDEKSEIEAILASEPPLPEAPIGQIYGRR